MQSHIERPPEVPVDTGADSRLTWLIIAVTFGAFILWGLLAQLDSGAIAMGEVVPDGKVRTIQSPDGGIIRSILVKEGERVRAGTELVQLDDTEARALLSTTESDLQGLHARLADVRLEISSWMARREALEKLEANAHEEGEISRKLYEQNFISRPRMLQILNQSAQTTAAIKENLAELSRARQKAAEIEGQIASLKERRSVAIEKLARTRIAAPEDGIVNNLKYVTIGGAIPPGGAILDLVPVNEKLVIEAKLLPDDIDQVNVGLQARVKLTAYKARSHIMLAGTVVSVSANTYRDESLQGHPYYKIRIEISPTEMQNLDLPLLTTGMLAQVDIVSAPRSAFRYLFDPIRDSFFRAFKEA